MMHNQHNPVAAIVEGMQQWWMQKMQPHAALVRWYLHSRETVMYEGFCKLEATVHGSVNELFVLFYTPFDDEATYSRDIIAYWIEIFKTAEKEKRKLADIGVQPDWDMTVYEKALENKEGGDFDTLLWNMMDDARKWAGQPASPLVLSLFPESMKSHGAFMNWLNTMLSKKRAPLLRILIFDEKESNYYGGFFEKNTEQCLTLTKELNLDAAIRKIATQGNPNDPEVMYRQCMFKMGDAAAKKDRPEVEHWGRKAIDTAKKSGNKMLLATAYISYAGMLFGFEEHVMIMDILDEGTRFCKREIDNGLTGMQNMLLQFYGFKASAWQLQKKTDKAVEWFMLQATEAKAMQLYLQSVSAYNKAYVIAKDKKMNKEAEAALEGNANLTPHLKEQEIQYSEYPILVNEYLEVQKHKGNERNMEKEQLLETVMKQNFGAGWKEKMDTLKTHFNKEDVKHTLLQQHKTA
jgi:hypothetical protein